MELEATLNYPAGVKLKGLVIANFRASYGGHLAGILGGSKSKKMVNIIIYHCAKVGAFFTKRTIRPKKLAMPLH